MRVPWLVTVAILVLAISAFWTIPDIQVAAYLGEVLAAVTSAIAVVWLIAGIRQQRDEIRLQRIALENQRQELELQRTEIEKLGHYSALSQVNALLEQFSKTLRERGIPNCNTVDELPSALVAAMPEL